MLFFSSRRRHTRWPRDWSSDVCSSDLSHRHEAAVQFISQWRANDKASRINSGNGIQLHLLIAVHEAVNQLAKGRTVLQQRGYIAEIDALLRPVGDGPNH